MQSILWMLIQTLASLLASACLLRAYARWQGMSPFGNPLVGFAHALTQWLVRPLGMVLKPSGRLDWPSIVAALVLGLVTSLAFAVLLGVLSIVLFNVTSRQFQPERLFTTCQES